MYKQEREMWKAKWKILRKVEVVSVDMVGRRKGGWRRLLGEEREVEEDCWEKKKSWKEGSKKLERVEEIYWKQTRH